MTVPASSSQIPVDVYTSILIEFICPVTSHPVGNHPAKERHHVRTATQFHPPAPPSRPIARFGPPLPGCPDLPALVVRLQELRACRHPLRPQGVRQHLPPPHEPDHRRPGAA